MESRYILVVAVALGLTLVTCTDDDATPSSSARAQPVRSLASPAPSPVTPSTPTTSATSTTTTTTTTTTSTVPPTTAPAAGIVAATCAVLQTGTWADRRSALIAFQPQYTTEGGTGTLTDAVRATCPDDLGRQAAAVALEQRADGADLRVVPVDLERCATDATVARIRNTTPEAIGFVVGGQISNDADRAQSGSMVWSIAPGSGEFVRAPNTGNADTCAFLGWAFLADGTATDAGAPAAPGPATTGDDPARWLPALLSAAGACAWARSPIAGGEADFEDLRALGDPALPPPADDVHPVVGVTICPGTTDQLTPDRMAFAFGVEYGPLGDHPGYWDLRYGAFRRGGDGRWRWLAAPIGLDGSLTGANCAPPIPHP